jgi:6,7-dimethyl-8-ribityllumazine synthase
MDSAGSAIPEGAMASLSGRVGRVLAGDSSGRGLRIGVGCSRFNGEITWRLLTGALDVLEERGVDRSDVTVAWVPGAFELPLLALRFAAGPNGSDAVLCLGAVIRGETGHYDLVAGECAAGIQRVQLDTGVPVAFGVLTTETLAQALARSEPDETNKGREAALTALEMCRLLRSV